MSDPNDPLGPAPGTPPASYGSAPLPPPSPPSYGAPAPAYGAPAPAYGAPGGYPAQPYGAPVASQTNGLAIAALICGVLSLTCFPPLGLVGIGLGVAALSRAKKMNGSGRGLAIGGIATGVLGTIATVVIVILLIVAANEADSDPVDGFCDTDRTLQDPDC